MLGGTKKDHKPHRSEREEASNCHKDFIKMEGRE